MEGSGKWPQGSPATATDTDTDTDPWSRQMSPLWVLMKLCAMDTTGVDPHTGRATFCFWSWRVLCWFLLYSSVSWVLSYTMDVDLVSLVAYSGVINLNFDVKLLLTIWKCCYTIHLVPLLMLLEARKFANYRNQWSSLQLKFVRSLGREMHLDMRRCVRRNVAFVVAFTALSPIVHLLSLLYTPPDMLSGSMRLAYGATNTYVFLIYALVVAYWNLTTSSLVACSNRLKAVLQGMFHGGRSACPGAVAAVEALWLDLSLLVAATGSTFCWTYGFVFLHFFTIVTSTMYITAVMLGEGRLILAAAELMFMSPLSIFLVTIHVAGHRVTETVGAQFRLAVHRARLSQAGAGAAGLRQALDRLLATMSSHQPTMHLAGTVTINKHLTVAMLGTVATYLVVILQFRSTS